MSPWMLDHEGRATSKQIQITQRHGGVCAQRSPIRGRHFGDRATLMGASPDDLRLVFEATDHAGHLAVSGFLGWQTSEVSYRKLEFGFAFDGGWLQNLIKELEEVGR